MTRAAPVPSELEAEGVEPSRDDVKPPRPPTRRPQAKRAAPATRAARFILPHTESADARRRMPACWGRLRKQVLERDKYRCRRCARPGRLEVHHQNGRPDDNRLENLVTLCRSCHIEAHRPPVAPDVAAWRALIGQSEY